MIKCTVIDLYRKSSECWLRPNTYAFLNVSAIILCLPPLHTCNLLLHDAQSVTELSFVTATNIMSALSTNELSLCSNHLALRTGLYSQRVCDHNSLQEGNKQEILQHSMCF